MAHRRSYRRVGKPEMHDAANEEAGSQRQTSCIVAAPVRVSDRFDEPPGRIADQSDRGEHEEYAPERRQQQFAHRAPGAGSPPATPETSASRQHADGAV